VFDSSALRSRLSGVRDRIARAAGRAGRDPASITLVAVSKTFSSDHVRAIADTGQLDFGENKVQEGLVKMEQTADLNLRWHLVGHLQSNKTKRAARFHVIHSIDDPRLLSRVDAAALEGEHPLDVLVQVDLADEPTKHGASAGELKPILDVAAGCRGARMTGLMLLPPASEDPEATRPFFVALRALRDHLIDEGATPGMLAQLSMGMSHDFEIAVEEGATMIRVGSAIFGPRPYGPP
jgi:pyridoxal phosphate enzyme (YggS family)